MNAVHMPDVVEHASAFSFDDTVERLAAAIAQAGLILFNRIDDHAGAREAGLAFLSQPAASPRFALRQLSPA